jgi:UDP-N-acetylglucosamine:LPS N-acetylglucosamine transferase
MLGRTMFITHAERDWRVLVNFVEAWRILHSKRPSVILSTGAGPLVPFAVVGKILGIPTIFVETFNRVTEPSLTGRIVKYITPFVFYQWRTLERWYHGGKYGGTLL